MSYLDVHWKGRPHYHVPRIRVAPRRSFQSQSLIQKIDNQAGRKPFHIPISKKSGGFKFGSRFRRRKTRSSRSASSRAWARRRASSKARQNIQVYGWNSTAAEVASIVTSPRVGSPFSSRAKTRRKTSLAHQLFPQTANTTIGPLTDGAASSTLYNRRPIGTKNAKDRSNSHDFKPVKLSPPCCGHEQQERTARSNVSLKHRENITQKPTYNSSKLRSRSLVSDPKIDPDRDFANTIDREPKRSFMVDRRTSKKSHIGETVVSSNDVEGPDFAVQQANGCGCGDLETATISSVLTSLLSEKVSRTSSQRRALEKFSQELKFYLQVAEAFPKPESASSRATTIISANTVAALRPYWNEFQSAGLAVSSKEQRGMAKQSSESRKVSAPLLMNVEDNEGDSKFRRGKSTADRSTDRSLLLLSRKGPRPSQMSDSTGTTVIGFTPPHEKMYGSSKMPVSRRGLPPNHTLIDCTRSRNTDMQLVSPTSRVSTKKSLPWLRKQAPQSDELLDRKRSSPKVTLKEDMLEDMILPLSPQEPLPLDEIIGFSSRKGTGIRKKTSGQSRISQFLSDTRLRDSDKEKKRCATIEVTDESTAYWAQIPKSIHLRGTQHQYSDIGTQTYHSNDVNVVGIDNEHHTMTSRASPPTCSTDTSSLVAVKCPEACCAATRQTLPVMPTSKSRLSKVHWEGSYEVAQMDELESRTLSESRVKGSTPSTSLSPVPDEHDQPSAISNGSYKVSSRPLASTTIRYPQSGTSTADKDIESQQNASNKYSPVSFAQHSPVPQCTQCDHETERVTRGSNLERPIESEYEIRLIAREFPTHKCRVKSSIQCQQCLPTRRESAAVSPLETSMPILQPKSAALVLSNEISTCSETASDSPSVVAVIQGGNPKRSSTGCGQEPLIPEPVKRPILPKLDTLHGSKTRTQPRTKSGLDSISLLCGKALPQIPQPINLSNPSPPESQNSRAASVDTCPCPRDPSSYKLALKGLHVATAAACDKDVNKWVYETTGLAVRQFLVDLGRYERSSGGNSPISTARSKSKNMTD